MQNTVEIGFEKFHIEVMSVAKAAVFIVGAKRTPFGAFGGKLKHLTGTDLAVHSSKAALANAHLTGSHVDETFFGNVISSSLDASYLSRHVALKSGAPIKSPCLTINRLWYIDCLQYLAHV